MKIYTLQLTIIKKNIFKTKKIFTELQFTDWLDAVGYADKIINQSKKLKSASYVVIDNNKNIITEFYK